MLTTTRSRTRKTTRPAPPGLWPAQLRFDRPPDGWAIVDASWKQRASVRMDHALLRMADVAARGTTRREFLRRAGAVGFLAGLNISGLIWGAVPAEAHEEPCRDASGEPGPCGPSPICAPRHCRSDGQCKLAFGDPGDVRRRGPWESIACASSTVMNCWVEHCCSVNNNHVRCCDCCTPNPPMGFTCTGTGCTTKRRCVCRDNQGGC